MSSIRIDQAKAMYPGTEEETIRRLAEAGNYWRIYKCANDFGDKVTHTDYCVCSNPFEERSLLTSPAAHNVVLVYDRGQILNLASPGDFRTAGASDKGDTNGMAGHTVERVSETYASQTPSPTTTEVNMCSRITHEAFFPMTAEEAKVVQKAAAEKLGVPLTTVLDCGNGVKLRLILIPAGRFLMGSPETEEGHQDDETPQREVTITHPFYMGIYEVTQKQYKAVMGENPSWYKAGYNIVLRVIWGQLFKSRLLPVESVQFEMANAFCVALSNRAGRTVRLPTEAEWEYACRAGTTTNRYGSLGAIGWYWGNSRRMPHPVGQKQPNAWGLYDMIGNLWEWCGPSYHVHSVVGTKTITVDVEGEPACRGGSWSFEPDGCRAAARLSPARRGLPPESYGFRICLHSVYG